MKKQLPLLLNFILPAMLLNSIGVVILMLHTSGNIALQSAGWIQPFKDGSVLVGSIILISFIAKFGYKKAIQAGCIIEIIGCLLMGSFPSLYSAYIFFIMAGVAFALLKISIYAAISLVTKNKDTHAGMISFLEGSFMVAIFIANGLFAWMIYLQKWYITFYIFAVFGLIALVSTFYLKLGETQIASEGPKFLSEYKKALSLFVQPAIWLFLLLTICYPFIEQGFIDFLPTFQAGVLDVSHSFSVLLAALLPAMIAIGRLLFSLVVKVLHVKLALFSSIILAIILMVFALLSAEYAVNYPFLGYIAMWVLPVIGLFIAPLYPTLNSTILSSQAKNKQSAVTLLIMIFSAIGASTGSVLTGYLFTYFGGIKAFSVYIVMLFLIVLLLIPYFLLIDRQTINIIDERSYDPN
ncbi:MFS transporter [Facilibium subflavum]|uniref:MFS transporter n=1 Tax=Facilibium subflavum TaxID=2219058 RepID=UPI000E65B56D|nr:MFS transporter [Facilibium subflavum]